MKNIHGLILAIGLGIAATILNFAYLNMRSGKDPTYFVAIAEGVTIAPNERLTEEHFTRVGIPESNVGNLAEVAVQYKDLATVLGMPAWRRLDEGALLLLDDLRTAPQELKLEPNERAMFVAVTSREFVPKLVAPGSEIDFVFTEPTPTLADPDAPSSGPSPPSETIGPFKILALGNRLGSSAVHRASKAPQVQENVLTIRVEVDEDTHQLNEKAQNLRSLLDRAVSDRGMSMSILLRPKNPEQPL